MSKNTKNTDTKIQTAEQYVNYLQRQRDSVSDKQWLPSITNFSKMIQENPILRMCWEHGTSQCPMLKDRRTQEILDILDTVCKVPPVYAFHQLVGFPINSIFLYFMQTESGRMFFSHSEVNNKLKDIINDYGKYLQSPESTKYLNSDPSYGWFTSDNLKKMKMEEFQCNPSLPHYGFKSWNQWFERKFKTGFRPIGEGKPEHIPMNHTVTNVCECYPLEHPIQPVSNIGRSSRFWLKSSPYSLYDIFGGEKHKAEKYCQMFEGGTIFQGFLSSMLYHRWHSPVSGTITDMYKIEGSYYLDQSQFIQFDKESPLNSQPFITAVAQRLLLLIRAHSGVHLLLLFVGMAEVSGCTPTVKVGDHVNQGDEIGYFRFGGSSHLIIFPKDCNIVFGKSLYKEQQNGQTTSEKLNVCSYLAHFQQ